MASTEEFLSLYNKLDSMVRLRYSIKDRGESAIIYLISKLRKEGYYKSYDMADDLDAIRSLRNSIVHTPSMDGESLYEVKDAAIVKLKAIIEHLEKPPLARDKAIPFSKLYCVHLDSNVLQAMKEMSRRGFSHAPLLDGEGKVIGVFSEDALFAYVASKGEASFLDGDSMRDIFDYLPLNAHPNERYAFLKRDALLSEAFEAFMNSKKETGKRLGMIFITEHGKKTEKVLYALSFGNMY